MSHLIFLDLETACLEPTSGQPLEIGMVAVNRKLEPVAHWHSPIKPFHGDWFSRLPPELVEMHSNSGLAGELRSERAHLKFEAGGFPTLQEAEAVACAFVAQFGHAPVTWRDGSVKGQALIAGFNVGRFEAAKWIPAHFPRLDAVCSHRSVDANFCWIMQQFLLDGPQVKPEARHRALPDCVAALNRVRGFFGLAEWTGALP